MNNASTALIPQLQNEDYINNPLGYAMAGGNWSMVQRKIYVAVLKKMQDRINERMSYAKKNGEQLTMLEHMFPPEELARDTISFVIRLSELGIHSKDYQHVKTACEQLANINCNFRYRNEQGELCEEFTHLFSSAIVYERIVGDKIHLTGKMEVKMGTTVADQVFSLKRGYVQQLENFIMECSNARTFPFYTYLCTLNTPKNNKEGDLPYMALMEVLGIVTYEPDDKKKQNPVWATKEGKGGSVSYKTYSIFDRDVLKKIQDEMNRLCINGKVEFSFIYEARRAGGKKIGTPESFHFTLIDRNHPTLFHPAEEVKPTPVNVPADITAKWSSMLEAIAAHNKNFHDTYAQCCHVSKCTADTVVIACPNDFVYKEWEANTEWLTPIMQESFPGMFINLNPETI